MQRGTEMFEDTADNMTGIVVYLNPAGVKKKDVALALSRSSRGARSSGRTQTNRPSVQISGDVLARPSGGADDRTWARLRLELGQGGVGKA